MENLITSTLGYSVANFFTAMVVPFVVRLLVILLVFFVGTKIIAMVRKILKKGLEKSNADKGVVTFLDNLVKIGLFLVLIVIILGFFGVEMTSIAAVVASAGVAVGLALQGSLSNLAGGVLILLLHPFGVGDYIVAAGLEGTVTEIQLFCTKLLTLDNRVVIIPNSTLSNGTIVNVSAMDTRRLDIPANISYKADLRTAKACLMSMLEDCPYTLKEEGYDVFVGNLAASSVALNVRLWVKKEDYWAAMAYVTENIKLKLDANGIEIPYSKMDVTIKQ